MSGNNNIVSHILSAAKQAGAEKNPEALIAFALAFDKATKTEGANKGSIAPAATGGDASKTEEKAVEGAYSLRTGAPPLDAALFKDSKSKEAESVRESQRRRYWVDDFEDIEGDTEEAKRKIQDAQKKQQAEKVALVDFACEFHQKFVTKRFEYDQMKKKVNAVNKEVGQLMRAKKRDEAKGKMEEAKELKKGLPAIESEANRFKAQRDVFMNQIGNICPSDRGMVWTRNEDRSPTPKGYHWGVGLEATDDKRRNTEKAPETMLNHVDLFHRLSIRDTNPSISGGPAEGAKVSGNRAYFLKGHGVSLNQALINYGLAFLEKRGYTQLHCPFFINKDMMALCAQLDDFDEQLYKVSDGSEVEKYLIATSEQAICCYHEGSRIEKRALPLKFAGYSTCFRKEVGSHGRDTLGVFRVHQFEKVEQFCVTHPEKSWEMMEDMIKASRDFYESLELPYKVINIVSGELNNAAAQKYDLEAWFPASRKFRELVSCSNCTDYQSRRVQAKISGAKAGKEPEYVHMLNSTLTATERTLCCIVENHQTDKGVNVPKVLQPYMPGGRAFIPFVQELPKPKKSSGKKKGGKKK
eukprot:g5188.t1